MCRFELRATPATSPRYRSGGILITSCTSNGMSGGADGCCAPRLTARPASRTKSTFFTKTSSPERGARRKRRVESYFRSDTRGQSSCPASAGPDENREGRLQAGPRGPSEGERYVRELLFLAGCLRAAADDDRHVRRHRDHTVVR